MSRLWITWEFQRRNIGISSALGWKLMQIEVEKSLWIRYLLSLWKTFILVMAEKPDVVAVQNPSIVLAVFAVFLAKISGFKIIMDAHNSGIYPTEGRSFLLMAVAKWLQKNADLVIVTNNDLKAVVENNGGRGIVLPDKIPAPPVQIDRLELKGRVNVAFVCTYSDDEPYQEVFAAASLLEEDIMIYVTGNHGGMINPANLPSNVRLLGFVPDKEYWELLSSVDIIMDLTLRENCLVCGAYEAVALCKPMILSNTRTLKSYFNGGCVYVDAKVQSIYHGIQESLETISILQADVRLLHCRLSRDWLKKFDGLKKYISDMTGTKRHTND